jgi:DNA sulfur modification protein DndD
MGRGQAKGSLHLTGNWDADTPGFEVELDFSHNDRKFRLIRTCRPKPGVGKPGRDEDYEVTYYLERDGHILGPQDAEDELKRIMPHDIMRFFLFDGELLQQYEDLLHTESALGVTISKAIEQILGLPVLTNARATLEQVKDRTVTRQALTAQADQKTRQIGNELRRLQAESQALTADLLRYEADLVEQRATKAGVEEGLRKREKIGALLDRRDRLESDLKTFTAREAQQRAQVAEAMADAWAAALRPSLVAARSRLLARETELQLLVTRTQVLKDLASAHASECPTCLQAISDAARVKIQIALEEMGGEAGDREARELSDVRRQLDALDRSLQASNPEAVRLRWDAFEQTRRDIYTAKDGIAEIDGQIQKGQEQDLRGLRLDYEQAVREIAALQEGLSATREQLAERNVARDRLQLRLAKLGVGDTDAASRQLALAADLDALFSEGVTTFRNQLKRRVEADATKYFLRIINEPEYAGLRINDAYGLTILHKDGSEIPVRSAGAEHVVALSLVAALQNNAPMRGPIVVDSPFGRLDDEHRRRIMATLPEMASQIVLLVYEAEMPPAQARPALKDKLLAEYMLERHGAKHTVLRKRRETEAA